MPGYRKKLIEVALPLKAINEASAREKSIRHGHPSTLHLWWARRPLAACRAVLFSSLVDDPDSDPAYQKPDGTVDEERAGIKRAELFNLIEELVQWENSNNPRVINAARAEIARCIASRKIELGELAKEEIIFGDNKGKKHAKGPLSGQGVTAWEVLLMKATPEVVNSFLTEHAPPVLDPFCGGGSIPLEAQRLGLRAYASDLNPVPVLITKALIEIPPKFAGRSPINSESRGEGSAPKGKQKTQKLISKEWPGATGLAEDVRYYGQWMRDDAERRIGHLYPKVEVTDEMAQDRPDLLAYVGQQLTVIAWLWARTVTSPNPACHGARVPLVRSYWLATKQTRKAWVVPIVDAISGRYRFAVRTGVGDAPKGTVSRNGATCILSGAPITLDYIRAEGQIGRLGTKMLAIVCEGKSERVYFSPIEKHEQVTTRITLPIDVPDTDMPEAALGFRVQNYGMVKHRHLFTDRQMLAMTTFCDLIDEVRHLASQGTNRNMDYANAVATYLALGVGRCADFWNTMATWSWQPKNELVGHAFGRQALPITWDFGEINPFSDSGGNFFGNLEFTIKALQRTPAAGVGRASQANALAIGGDGYCLSTDPPYYDNVAYADLSDFFYIWLRRSLDDVYPDLLSTVLVPKSEELVADPFRHGGKENARNFFENGMRRFFDRMRDRCDPSVPATIYYAFKQSEGEDDEEEAAEVSGNEGSRSSTGWETFLQGLCDTRWQIEGTWPVRTERSGRLRDNASNALASSIVLVCRPRPDHAPLATRKEFITALRGELPGALRNLQRGNIAPVDLAQAAIGPGMAIFTRHAKVIESDGSPMPVRAALGIINQVLDEVLAEQEGDFDSDTRWALAWFDQFGTSEGPFGAAETLSKAKNTAVNGLVDAGVVKARAGKVQLVARGELNGDWDPATDNRLTVWETTQHLIHTLETKGESEAAVLINKLGGLAETARELAYRLYSICERKKWADEALAYNGLVIAWPELTKLAAAERHRGPTAEQREMF